MTEEAKILPVEEKPKRAPTLYFIVAIKLTKGALLLIGAVSVYLLANKNLPDLFDQFLRWMHFDPEGRFFNAIGDRLDTVTPRNVHVIASWMFLYGLFLTVGGLGLAFRVPWAVWLAIGESAFFIPIEIYELIRQHIPNPNAPEHAMFAHPKIGIAAVLVVNVFIVWYLFKNRERLFRHHHHH
jgi:uncharacterized membrane protein (DUF2068 family)